MFRNQTPVAEPKELSVSEVLLLARDGLVYEILSYNDRCFFDFDEDYLRDLSERKLRRLLFAVRRHYRLKGY